MKVTVIKDSVIYQQKIYRVDEVIDISDDETAKSLLDRGCVAVDVPQWQEIAPEIDEADLHDIEYTAESLAEFDRKELQQIAKELGVKASGTNEEIIEIGRAHV